MFKNSDKVFKFTFKNQVKSKAYLLVTFLTAIFLLVLPMIISAIVVNEKEKNAKKPKNTYISTIKNVYVVNEIEPNADFSMLASIEDKNVRTINYKNFKTVEEALYAINENDKTAVLHIRKADKEILATLVRSDKANLKDDDYDSYMSYISKYNNVLCLVSLGINEEKLAPLMLGFSGSIYDETGYSDDKDIYSVEESTSEQGKTDDKVLKNMKSAFHKVLIFVICMFLYFVILFYGTAIANHVVSEKSSKLVDTLLISVSTDSLLFGKVLGILISGLLQLFLWIGSLILGLVGAYKIIVASSIGKGLSVIQFIKAFGKLGIFTPTNVILAIIALLSGILVYASLSAIVGGLSSTREDVSVNSSYFVILLLISFYVVLFGGVVGDFNPMWMNYVPFVSALILPANLCIGELNIVFGLIAILENLLLVTLFITFASRLYRATIFYKGNRLGIVKAFNMVFSKQK